MGVIYHTGLMEPVCFYFVATTSRHDSSCPFDLRGLDVLLESEVV